jgi:hypothetical protein
MSLLEGFHKTSRFNFFNFNFFISIKNPRMEINKIQATNLPLDLAVKNLGFRRFEDLEVENLGFRRFEDLEVKNLGFRRFEDLEVENLGFEELPSD